MKFQTLGRVERQTTPAEQNLALRPPPLPFNWIAPGEPFFVALACANKARTDQVDWWTVCTVWRDRR